VAGPAAEESEKKTRCLNEDCCGGSEVNNEFPLMTDDGLEKRPRSSIPSGGGEPTQPPVTEECLGRGALKGACEHASGGRPVGDRVTGMEPGLDLITRIKSLGKNREKGRCW
jgi:hypothetical protein